MRPLAKVVDRAAIPVLVVMGAGLLFLGWHAPRYSFEYNYLNLEPAGVESFELVHKIPEWFNIDVNFGMIISHSVEEDRRLASVLRGKTAAVSRGVALSDFIPAAQEEKLKQIGRRKAALSGLAPVPLDASPSEPPAMSPREFDLLLARLRSLRDSIGAPGRGLIGLFYMAEMEEAEDGARKLLGDLEHLIASLEGARGPQLYENLGRLDQAVAGGIVKSWDRLRIMTSTSGLDLEIMKKKHPEMVDRFLGRDGSFMIYVFPSITIWDENNLKAVATGLRKVAEENHTQTMGVALLFDEILRQIKSDLVRIASLALFMVFCVLVLSYRQFWHTLLTLIPLVAGGVAMVGLMNLRGLKFNIVNTGMLPLLIGIGVDYGVYTVHRWIDEGKGPKSIRPVVESTGRAVTLSALTTMIGFSAVILCRWRGLSMMGATLTMGIGLCWLAAVVFLPALLKVITMVKSGKTTPDDKTQ
jgi:hypothetical protein